MTTLYLCGAGNPEAIRLAVVVNQHSGRWDRIVVLDDDPAKHGRSIVGVKVVGGFDMLDVANPQTSEVANLVARTTAKRWAAWRKIAASGLRAATLLHPDVDTFGVTLGDNLIVYQYASLGANATIGDGSVVFTGAIVGHGSQVGACCVLAPHAVLNARVQMGDGVYVGTNASVLPDVKIGAWATIGAGSVAMTDVPEGATVLGVPGRIVYKLRPKQFVPHELRGLDDARPGAFDRKARRESLTG